MKDTLKFAVVNVTTVQWEVNTILKLIPNAAYYSVKNSISPFHLQWYRLPYRHRLAVDVVLDV
jgi:hypothetical protein